MSSRAKRIEAFMDEYKEELRTMSAEDICVEYSYLVAVMHEVEEPDDKSSMAALLIDDMFQHCTNQVLARVVNKSLDPYDLV